MTFVESESPVGGYSLDILAKEDDTDDVVVIENQLGNTDHDHLGKIITYGAGKDAKYIIWVVKSAREEHKAAIEWLNANLSNDVGLFLVEIQLWSIDGSAIAPKFEIVESPNNWSRTTKAAQNTSGVAVQIKYDYWSNFNDYVYGGGKAPAFAKLFHQRKASSDHWYNLSLGVSRMHMSLLVNTKANIISVEFYIASPNMDKSIFDNIYTNHRGDIETKLGFPLDWRRLDDKQCSRILLENKSFDIMNEDQRPQQYIWLTSKALEIRKAFLPYIN